MIVHHFRAQQVHHFIKSLGGAALKRRIRLTAVAHPVDHIAALAEFPDKFTQNLHIILQVGVHAHGAVTLLFDGHQPGQQGILMAAVAAELQSADSGMILLQPGDQGPGIIPAAVIHIDNAAVFATQSVLFHAGQFIQQYTGGFGQNLLLVIAGDNDK